VREWATSGELVGAADLPDDAGRVACAARRLP
jgi:hypothetical protein